MFMGWIGGSIGISYFLWRSLEYPEQSWTSLKDQVNSKSIDKITMYYKDFKLNHGYIICQSNGTKTKIHVYDWKKSKLVLE